MLMDTNKFYHIHYYFADLAAHDYSQKLAVVLEAQCLSYAEVFQASHYLATQLLRYGYIKNVGDIVCQCVERSIEMAIGVMSILMSGGVYCPFTPEEPQGRINTLIEESHPSCVLVHTSTVNKLSEVTRVDTVPIILQAFNDFQSQEDSMTLPHPSPSPESPFAIVIFTSGSTGKPKGIQISHANFIDAVAGVEYEDILTKNDTVLQRTPVTFDMHLQDIIGSFMLGACLVLIPPGTDRDIAYIIDTCAKHQISCLSTVPTVWNAFIDHEPILKEKLPTIRILLSSGESLPISTASTLLKKIPAKAKLINGYGPAECTLCSTTHVVSESDVESGSIPIGHPDPAHRCVICDESLQPVIPGDVGELFVSGPAVFRAYLNRSDLTELALINISNQGTKKFYRTGDLVRIDPSSGLLYFAGRKDFQVKLRGQRIECEEVEHCLASCLLEKPVTRVVVVKKRYLDMEHLVAYVESHEKKIQQKLRAHCGHHLPQYMVPSFFVILDHLPLNQNGKIDRKNLPEPDFSKAIIETQQEDIFESPKTETERVVLCLWQELLNIDTRHISTNSSFFTLSGNSLSLMRLVRSYSTYFYTNHRMLPVAKFFQKPTIAEHARLIDENTISNFHEEIEEHSNLNSLEGPATYSQMSIFADSQVRFYTRTDSALQNVPYIYKVDGNLHVNRLRQALNQVIFKQSVLRTSLYFDNKTGELRQKVMDFDKGNCYTFVESYVNTSEEFMVLLANEKTNKTLLDPFSGHVFRCHVIHSNSDLTFVCFNFHHSAADGESHIIFSRDLEKAYLDPSNSLQPLQFSYIDYAWQQSKESCPKGERIKATLDMKFWKMMFDQTTSIAFHEALPYDKPSYTRRFGSGYTHNVFLPVDAAERTHALARKLNVTVTQVVLAAFYAFIFRLTQQNDVYVGLPTVNRDGHHSLFDIVGSFVNVLPLRCQIVPEEPFVTLIEKTKALIVSSLTHARPYMHILHQTHCSPLRIIFEVEWTPWFERDISLGEGNNLVPYQERDDSLFDIFCCVDVGTDGKRVGIKYNAATDVFNRKTICEMAERLALAIADLTRFPEKPVFLLSLILPSEVVLVNSFLAADGVQRQLSRCKSQDCKTSTAFEHSLIHFRFAIGAAVDHPQKVAVIMEEQFLSYAEMLHVSSELSTLLQKCGYIKKVGAIICHCMEKSIEMIIGIAAILMSGGVYCPVSSEDPWARIERILNECRPTCVLVHPQTKDRFNSINSIVIDITKMILDSFDVGQRNHFCDVTPLNLTGNSLAAIAFTSGSTGQPKGVCLTHHNFIFYITGEEAHGIISKHDTVLQRTPVTFSMHLQETVGSLWLGASIILVRSSMQRNITGILSMYKNHQASYAVLPSTLLAAIFKQITDFDTFATTRAIVTGAEPLQPAIAAKTLALLPVKAKLIYSYGQTEAPLDIMHYEVFPGDLVSDKIPIGRNLLPGYSLILLDNYLQPVIPGQVGEICISGKGVFVGYLNRSDLTSAALVKLSLYEEYGLFYRTGDLGRMDSSSHLLYYVNRKDFQIKLRGQRIECGEIEQVILSCKAVHISRVVIVKRNHGETEHLVAFLELERETSAVNDDQDSAENIMQQTLKSHCEHHLPQYMIPSLFVVLPRLPLNANSKIDRNALPTPDFSKLLAGIQHLNTIERPRTDTENAVLELWSDLLNLSSERISITSSLFALGGNSLLLMHLVRSYETQLHVNLGTLSFGDFFEKPTIHDHGRLIDGCSK